MKLVEITGTDTERVFEMDYNFCIRLLYSWHVENASKIKANQ